MLPPGSRLQVKANFVQVLSHRSGGVITRGTWYTLHEEHAPLCGCSTADHEAGCPVTQYRLGRRVGDVTLCDGNGPIRNRAGTPLHIESHMLILDMDVPSPTSQGGTVQEYQGSERVRFDSNYAQYVHSLTGADTGADATFTVASLISPEEVIVCDARGEILTFNDVPFRVLTAWIQKAA